MPFAARFGHTIVPPRPALVPITIDAPWVAELRGVTLPDVGLRVLEGAKVLQAGRGSLLFAHFGLIRAGRFSTSVASSAAIAAPKSLSLEMDLLPNWKEADLDEHLRIETAAAGKKQLAAVLSVHLPRRLCEALLPQAGLPIDRRAAALSRPDRGSAGRLPETAPPAE